MKCIAVVDDSSFCRQLLAHALKNYGFETLTASTGLEAIPLLQRRKPDLLILGLKLPDMDGLKTLRLIRTLQNLKDLPIFILSYEDSRACIVQATQIGVQACILQSQFNLESFIKRVQDQVGATPPAAAAPTAATPPTRTTAPAASSAIQEVWGAVT